jgi:hypothetical protein
MTWFFFILMFDGGGGGLDVGSDDYGRTKRSKSQLDRGVIFV